jgi:hypothetical protein
LFEGFGVGLVACSPVSNQMPPNSEVSALTIKASDVVTRRQAAPNTDLTQHRDLHSQIGFSGGRNI